MTCHFAKTATMLLWSVAATSILSPAIAQTTYEYDELGRLIEVVDTQYGSSVEYDYDETGNRESVVFTAPLDPVLSVSNASATEGGSVSFTVTRSDNTAGATDVDYATSNGSATAGSDYTAVDNTLSFAAGETSKTVNVSTLPDGSFEGNETFVLTLSNPTAPATIGTGVATGTINDDDTGPSFSVNDVSVSEGGNLSFTVTKTGTTSQTHNVSYATANGTAGSSDYTSKSGALSFTSGQTTKTVSVSTTEDSIYENNETIYLNLSNATNGASISDSQGVGTVNNDDSAPSFSVNNVSVSEGGNLVFTVTKSGATAKTHAVDYATANGTATAGSDYTSKSGNLSFTSGQTTKTVSVSTIEDTTYEPNETMKLNISNPTNGATISDSQGIGTINNDDAEIEYVKINGVLQSGYTDTETYHSLHDDYLYRTKEDSTSTWIYIHHGNVGYCDQTVTLASGFSWSGSNCTIIKD